MYIKFLLDNQKMFSCENLRRTGRVFMRLSQFMAGLRTPNQCKSHHQKMQKVTKNGTIPEVIQYLETKHSIGASTQAEPAHPNGDTALQWEGNGYVISMPQSLNCAEVRVTVDLGEVAAW
jgi:hypothetical protein